MNQEFIELTLESLRDLNELDYYLELMINQEYLTYWLKTINNIILLEQLLQDNLHSYLETQYVEYLEYLQNNTKEIIKLKTQAKEYYIKLFKP